MNGVGNRGPGSVIIVKEATRGGGGGGPGLQRLVELNPRNLSAEEGFDRNPPLHPSPSEVQGRIFEVVDGSRISFSTGYSVLNPFPPKICTASVAFLLATSPAKALAIDAMCVLRTP